MGGGDYCAVFGCSNDRRKPEKNVVMDHVGTLRWYKPKTEKDMKQWEKLLNRGGGFKCSMSTKVCSNHFAAGYRSDICTLPTLYLKGYDKNGESSVKRKSPSKRKKSLDFSSPPKKARPVIRSGADNTCIMNDIVSTAQLEDHLYDTQCISSSCARCEKFEFCKRCEKLSATIIELQKKIQDMESELKTTKKTLQELKKDKKAEKNIFTYNQVKESDKALKFYTGLQNSKVFDWIMSKIEHKISRLQYFQGEKSFVEKNYQRKKQKKSGKKSSLSPENCLLLTLMRLRVGLPEQDIAFRFGISQSLVSRILVTWITFLSRELSCLIYWPQREDVMRYYPKCFKNYQNVVGIIDCTEGILEKPSIAKAQSQTYSSYKSRNTWKKLICITPAGTISFISKCYGGCASDRFITENCLIINKLEMGDNLMADKGFNISDLLISKGSQLIIPPFLRDKGRFSMKNCKKTANIAKARIHVERAIARIKDFRILNGAFPITLKDLLDDIFLICAAITNLAPPLVPL